MSSFTFGQPQPNSSGQSSGGLFGTAGAKNDGQSLFGGGGSGSGSGTGAGWSFGQAANTGSSSGNTENKTGGLFGSSTPLFGKPAENKGNESKAPSPFSPTPGTPSQPTSSASAFGTTTPAASGAGLFGGIASTTPAGQPPATSLFGASTGASASQSQPTSKPTFSFGNTAAAASSGSSTPVTKPPAGMFGQQPSQPSQPSSTGGALFSQGASGGLFGAKTSTPASTSAAPTSSLFGNVGSSGGGGMFGAKPADSNPQPASSGPTFSFGAPKKDDKPAESSAQKPFSFPTTSGAAAPASSQPAAASQPASTGLFGQTSAPASSAGSTPSLFGNANPGSSGGGLFAKPGAPASQSGEQPKSSLFSTPATSTTATSQPALPAASKPFSAFSLGGAAASQPASTASTTAPTTTATSTAAPTGLFANLGGAASASGPGPAASSSAAPTSTTTAPSATPAASAPSASNLFSQTQALNASTSGPPAPAQSRLRNKTMEEILTRWASDLTRYTKEFKQHAETIAKWDQIIVDNSTKIDKLYVKTRTCEKQTMSVEMQLAAVENQQNELESWLAKYENDVDEMLAKDGPAPHELGGPDQERERTYKLAERLGERLDDMSSDLKSMIEEVNASNELLGGSNKADEPITQIVKILNSHLSQLQAIDQGTSALQAKVTAAQKTAQGMNYMNVNGGLGGDNAAAVDGFYRSYMGRR